jgi:hypothetical protein
MIIMVERDSDHPRVLIHGDGKENLTALATIIASDDRLSLFFLAHGRTERIERSQIGDVTPHWVSHSTNGWMAKKILEQYIGLLRQYYPDGPELYLMLDSNSAHRNEGMKERVKALNTRLFFIPPGMTEVFQPLQFECDVSKCSAKSH